jgi:hypothetical protein
MSKLTLPRYLKCSSLSPVVGELIRSTPDGKLPSHIQFDFSPLYFIEPAGVVFLSNLLHWLKQKGIQVTLSGIDLKKAPICYLDDSLFFEQHLGEKQRPFAMLRDTTQPLQNLSSSESHAWLDLHLIPWLARSITRQIEDLYTLRVSLSELFSNVNNHTRHDIGSVFVQHYPNYKTIKMAVADFGEGIPNTVRRVEPDLDDNTAILKAVEQGFSSRSIPTNRGQGLSYLLDTVVLIHSGVVTVCSQRAIVVFSRSPDGKILSEALPNVGFCPGTTIEISLRTDAILHLDEDEEDLQW